MRLTNHLERQHFLNDRQFGFWKGRSAADITPLTNNKWSNALERAKLTAVVTLDSAGAFDRIWQAAMIGKLRLVEVSRALLKLLLDYLQWRHLRAEVFLPQY